MFLAIFTAVFMLSAVSFAEESSDYAAMIGSTGYASLTDAIDSVKNSETVTLLRMPLSVNLL